VGYDRPMRTLSLAAAFFGVLFVGGISNQTLSAHHSFVVFFEDAKNITVSGSVTAFKFTNPHAIIELTVKNERGQNEAWRAETNAVTLLRRRGWTKESLKAGDAITIDGWPSRDGSPYMRVRRVVKADGTVLGAPTNQRAD
jgi:hypothetical protein